jgi:TIR domain
MERAGRFVIRTSLVTHIFISYSREDRERAESLARVLEGQGWSVWWDRHVQVGQAFDRVIAEALDAAVAVVVLWSAASVKSKWVLDEAADGDRREILFPVLIEDVRLPLGFGRLQAADLKDWRGASDHEGLRAFLAALSARLGGKPSPVPPPKPAPVPASKPSPDVDKALQKILQKRSRLRDFYVAPDIPAGKLQTARERCKVPPGEKALALIDCTVFGTASDAVVLGREGVYFRNFTGHQGHLLYRQLAQLTMEGAGMYVSFSNGQVCDLTGSQFPGEQLAALLREIAAVLAS